VFCAVSVAFGTPAALVGVTAHAPEVLREESREFRLVSRLAPCGLLLAGDDEGCRCASPCCGGVERRATLVVGRPTIVVTGVQTRQQLQQFVAGIPLLACLAGSDQATATSPCIAT
jgi:hypothetical protein